MALEKITIQNAYMFTCKSCKGETFVHPVNVEMSDEDRAGQHEMYPEVPEEEWRTGKWIVAPDEVKCQHCGDEFEVDHGVRPEDDEDDNEGEEWKRGAGEDS